MRINTLPGRAVAAVLTLLVPWAPASATPAPYSTLVALPDFPGTHDLAYVVQPQPTGALPIGAPPEFDIVAADTGEALNQLAFFGSGAWTWVNMASYSDANRDGTADDPALAVLARQIFTDQIKVQLREASSGAQLRTNLTFFSGAWEPYDVAALNDANGDGTTDDPAIAVLAQNLESGRIMVEVKQVSNGAQLARFAFFTPDWVPKSVIAYTTNDGESHVAVLATHSLTGQVKAQMRRISDGLKSGMFLAGPSYLARDMGFIADLNGDGTADDPGLALLSRRLLVAGPLLVYGNNVIRIRRLDDGTRVQEFRMLGSDYSATRLSVLPDSDGNGFAEVAAIARLADPEDYLIKHRDLASGANVAELDLWTQPSCPGWTAARPLDNEGRTVCQLPAQILDDRTLTNDIVWYMAGRVTVGNGNREMSVVEGVLENSDAVVNATLTIQAGTEIKGDTGSFANLLITRGSRIEAVGTKSQPIVFSSDDAGFSGSGEWGGIILHGYAPHNECLQADEGIVGCNIDAEGESGFAGGYTADDDSGILRYVIVTEGGYEFSPGNEINGISLVAVGDGTTLEYLQVNDSDDDGIEFFGGTVDARYLVLTGNLDDSLDWDEGWQGNIQYLLSVQGPAAFGNAIEADTEGTVDFYSTPTVANATFVTSADNDEAFVFKQSTGGFLLNSIVDGSGLQVAPRACVRVDGFGTEANIGIRLAFNNVIARCDAFGVDTTDDSLGASGVTLTNSLLDANYAAQAAAADGVNIDLAGFKAAYPESVADDGFLDDTDYLGAIDPGAATPWFDGWVLEGSL